MAKAKTECPLAIAKAVARMQEQAPVTKWESLHTATLVRYIVLDVLAECKASPEMTKAVSEKLKAILLATPAICESSNLGKRLVDWGEVKEQTVTYE